jgi:hypothetical protein
MQNNGIQNDLTNPCRQPDEQGGPPRTPQCQERCRYNCREKARRTHDYVRKQIWFAVSAFFTFLDIAARIQCLLEVDPSVDRKGKCFGGVTQDWDVDTSVAVSTEDDCVHDSLAHVSLPRFDTRLSFFFESGDYGLGVSLVDGGNVHGRLRVKELSGSFLIRAKARLEWGGGDRSVNWTTCKVAKRSTENQKTLPARYSNEPTHKTRIR